MNDSLVSIIVPVYKVERFLEKCVLSLLNQSYPHLEIILVDDGSPDNCPKMCDDFANLDPRIKVIHQDNLGLPKARKSGYEISTGDYIFFVDSDDYIEKDCIKILIDHAHKSGADIVVAGINNVSENGIFVIPRLKPKIYDKEDITKLLSTDFLFDKAFKVSAYPLYAWGKLIKKEMMDGYFDVSTQFRYWEDMPSTFFLIKKINVLEVVENCLYNYVIHKDQVTQKPIKDIWHFYVDVWNYLVATDTDNFFNKQLPQRIWHTILSQLNISIRNNEGYGEFYNKFQLFRNTPVVINSLANKSSLDLQAPSHKLFYFLFIRNFSRIYYILDKYELIVKLKKIIKHK